MGERERAAAVGAADAGRPARPHGVDEDGRRALELAHRITSIMAGGIFAGGNGSPR